MLPFYIFYSMFGFQRVGDLIWAAADQRARGFLIGATAGRTTLGGEGLQHQDGSSHIVAATIPNCRAYDPAFAYELAIILEPGARAMLEEGKDEFYYVTAMNENYAQPSLPEGVEGDIIKGLYRVDVRAPEGSSARVRLLGSGAILRKCSRPPVGLRRTGASLLKCGAPPAFPSLRTTRGGRAAKPANPLSAPETSHVARCLPGPSPIIAATDYVRAYPQLIASYVEAPFTALGTDGFGRSDTRAALRSFFEVDSGHVVVAALAALITEGSVSQETVAEAIMKYGIEVPHEAPWSR